MDQIGERSGIKGVDSHSLDNDQRIEIDEKATFTRNPYRDQLALALT
jgi:hypothetical protein